MAPCQSAQLYLTLSLVLIGISPLCFRDNADGINYVHFAQQFFLICVCGLLQHVSTVMCVFVEHVLQLWRIIV